MTLAYRAASIEVDVKVEAYASPISDGYQPRRTVTLNLREIFQDDEGLDKAIESFAATIREAARR